MKKLSYAVDGTDALAAVLAASLGSAGGYGLYKALVPKEKQTLGKALGFTLTGGLGAGGLGYAGSHYAGEKLQEKAKDLQAAIGARLSKKEKELDNPAKS